MKRTIRNGNHKEAFLRQTNHAVFSIATNGYEKKFAFCIRSQQEYCRRLGVPYFLLQGRPPWGIGSHDSAWLKIPTLHFLLKYYHGGVLYLDADCEVLQHSDDFRVWDRDEPGKSLFAARDFSNRINAAVIYCRGTPQGRSLMRRLAWSAFVPEFFLPRKDRNLYENGHFIWICKNATDLHILPNEWNCGIYNELTNPHILHHGGTVMREARGEQPTAWRSRLFAAWTGLRLPVHMAWFSKCLQYPLETGAGEY